MDNNKTQFNVNEAYLNNNTFEYISIIKFVTCGIVV